MQPATGQCPGSAERLESAPPSSSPFLPGPQAAGVASSSSSSVPPAAAAGVAEAEAEGAAFADTDDGEGAADEMSGPLSPSCMAGPPALPSFASVMAAGSGETFSQDFKRYQQQRSKNKAQEWGEAGAQDLEVVVEMRMHQ
ncbi:hypothetical protein CLOM_g1725 [Closterium sp. NIES-68]|nr:hypothetical protein CLOM_g1725 [Closterium sp. NIES-68]